MHRVHQPYQLIRMFIFIMLLHGLPLGNMTYAEPTVQLLLEPDTRTLHVGSEPEEIWIQAQLTGEDLQIEWDIQGPGEFQRLSSGGIYTVPQSLRQASATSTIVVTVTDKKGKAATDSVIFTLLDPLSDFPVSPFPSPTMPALTPGPTPTSPLPSPATPIPTSIKKIRQHLHNAETYMNKKWLTTPKNTNAFAEYRAVLEIDSANSDARKGMHAILETYKLWAEHEDKKENYQKANSLYQRYQVVANYMLNTLGEQELRQELQRITARLEQTTPFPGPTPVVTPTPAATATTLLLSNSNVIPGPTPVVTPTPAATAIPLRRSNSDVIPNPPSSKMLRAPLPSHELCTRLANSLNTIKAYSQEYDTLFDYNDPPACEQKISILTNIIQDSKRMHEILSYQTGSDRCFLSGDAGKLRQQQMLQISRVFEEKKHELSAIKERCSVSAHSDEKFENVLAGLFEMLNLERNRYQELLDSGENTPCNQKISVLTNIIENLQALQEAMMRQKALGKYLVLKERSKRERRISQVEKDLIRYKHEIATVSDQCYNSMSCEEIEMLLSPLLENLTQNRNEYQYSCTQRRETLTNIIGSLHETQQLIRQVAPDECMLPEESQNITSLLPQIEQDFIQYQQEFSSLQKQCSF